MRRIHFHEHACLHHSVLYDRKLGGCTCSNGVSVPVVVTAATGMGRLLAHRRAAGTSTAGARLSFG